MADSGDDERLLLLLLLFILVCNGTRHNTMVINSQTENPRKLQPYNSMILTNENIK